MTWADLFRRLWRSLVLRFPGLPRVPGAAAYLDRVSFSDSQRFVSVWRLRDSDNPGAVVHG